MTKQLDLFTQKFHLTETGLEVEGKPDFEEWMEYGQSLKVLDGTARRVSSLNRLHTIGSIAPARPHKHQGY